MVARLPFFPAASTATARWRAALLVWLTGLASASGAVAAPQAPAERVTFSSSGAQVVGYLHRPAAADRRPIVLMAHGFGGLQSSRLQPIADAFADAGYNALTFDYRGWGESGGKPRNVIDVRAQQHDYIAAAAAAKQWPGVDGNKIILWGTSFSGGHVLELARRSIRTAAVIAQAPHVNGAATIGMLPLSDLPAKIAAGVDDQTRALLGQRPRYVPLVGRSGSTALLTQPEAITGYAFVQPTSPPPGNVAAARIVLALPFFNPEFTVRRLPVPTLIAVKTGDRIVSPGAAIRMARQIHATLKTYPGGHFDVYPGAPGWPEAIADQIAFLHDQVPIPTPVTPAT